MSIPRRIIVPTAPDAILSPNRNAKWGYREKRAARESLQVASKYAALETARMGCIEQQVRVTACICWPYRRQRMDLDNLGAMLKGMWDGFTNAGLWRDDRQMMALTVTQERLDRAGNANWPGGCIVVDIEEVQENADGTLELPTEDDLFSHRVGETE